MLGEIFDSRYQFFQDGLISEEETTKDADVIISTAGSLKKLEFVEFGCGECRLLRKLKERGINCSGVEASKYMVEESYKRNKKLGFDIRVHNKNLLDSALADHVSVGICWFTSFGFYDEASNIKILKNIFNSISLGGMFILDLINKDSLLMNLEKVIVQEKSGYYKVDLHRFDSYQSRLFTKRLYFLDSFSIVEFSVRVYSPIEIVSALSWVGFKDVEIIGDFRECLPGRIRVVGKK